MTLTHLIGSEYVDEYGNHYLEDWSVSHDGSKAIPCDGEYCLFCARESDYITWLGQTINDSEKGCLIYPGLD